MIKTRRNLLLSAITLLTLLGMLVAGAVYLRAGASAAGIGPSVIQGSSSAWTRSPSVHRLGHHASTDKLTIGVLLSTRDQAGQVALLKALYHSNSAQYHAWLSANAFSASFAPSAADVAAVSSFLTGSGMTLAASPDASLVLATGTTAQVEAAFHTEIDDFSTSSGSFYGSVKDLAVPANIRSAVLGVVGSSNLPVAKSNTMPAESATPGAVPPPYGGGPFGSGLTPSQLVSLYDAQKVHAQGDEGEGTTLAVYELAGYQASDIAKYEDHYHLAHPKLVNVPVLGGATSDNGASEVELDIELQIAMAPEVKQLLVYEAPNTELGALSEYLQIAKDNRADAISTSWGIICEFFVNSQITLAENQIFLQMALQGQSIFAASGDAGAYGCSRAGILPPAGQELQIGDPNNQPYITSVGGTSFQGPDGVTTFDPGKNPNPTYPGASKELPWTDFCDPQTCAGGATGGGVSRVWGEPDYAADPTTGQYFPGVIGSYTQTGAYCGQQPGVVCRENPDVSLDADPSTGYSIYCTDPGDSFCATGEFGKPGWIRLGGTSCAAPVWAAIAALDITKHHARLGLFNYIVYPFDSTAGYASQFHDIVSAFTNGSGGTVNGQNVPPGYAANAGYDLETGVGTVDVFNFINS